MHCKCRTCKHTTDVVLVCIYVISATAMPLFNYYVMTKKYSYPINFTAIQMLFTSLIVMVVDLCIKKYSQRNLRDVPNNLEAEQQSSKKKITSWVFDKATLFKVVHILLPAFLFSLDISMNNTSLFLTSVTVSCVIKTCGVALSVLLAFVVRGERCSKLGLVCVFVILLGSCLTTSSVILTSSGDLSTKVVSAMGIAMAFVSCLIGNVYSIVVKRVTELYSFARPPIKIHATEMTSMVFGFVSLLMFIYALIMEPGCWSGFKGADAEVYWSLAGGTLLTLSMKLSQTWLLIRQQMISYGVACDTKLVPQLLLDALFFDKYPFTIMMGFGCGFCVVGVIAFGIIKIVGDKKKRRKGCDERLLANKSPI